MPQNPAADELSHLLGRHVALDDNLGSASMGGTVAEQIKIPRLVGMRLFRRRLPSQP
jgi:hypothetical protein